MKYCEKCGKELMDEAVICPNCGCPTSIFVANHNAQQTTNVPSKDYLLIRDFYERATMLRNLGIVAAILMFGIGIIFSIIIWVKANGIKEPAVQTTNPSELAEFEIAKKRLKSATNLASLPIFGIGFGFIIGGMIAMFSNI